jgi:5-methylcytosine-specific restriction endonuclease McrA
VAVPDFIFSDPTVNSYWRAIILFGRNVACYKFALAKALLDIKPEEGCLVKLDEIAPYFAKHVSLHLKTNPKQATSSSSKFLDACAQYNIDGDESALVDKTIKLGFKNVIDAFHVVDKSVIEKPFFIDDRESNGALKITDNFSKLLESPNFQNLQAEVESRWNLVETAWELNVSRSLLTVNHDASQNQLYVFDRSNRRRNVTSSRGALNGYQKGKCFYCRCNINVDLFVDVDVDHFFPDMLKSRDPYLGSRVDGVWNLVLSCKNCNRGVGGKFHSIPDINLLEKLHHRNEYLIGSLHPLRETLISQTGLNESARRHFLGNFHERARSVVLSSWTPP